VTQIGASPAQVAITGRDQKTLDPAVQQRGPQAVAYRSDASDSAARKELFAKLRGTLRRGGYLWSNQSRTHGGRTFRKYHPSQFDGCFFHRWIGAASSQDGSSIIFSGSVIVSLSKSGYAAYPASKAGGRAMPRSLAADLSPRGIRVNVISPGATKTPIWGRNPISPKKAGEAAKHIASRIPLGRRDS
jgi:NAD(P)-dependent dehydrogenase (short-subunit alcohol dehydrogenase family)